MWCDKLLVLIYSWVKLFTLRCLLHDWHLLVLLLLLLLHLLLVIRLIDWNLLLFLRHAHDGVSAILTSFHWIAMIIHLNVLLSSDNTSIKSISFRLVNSLFPTLIIHHVRIVLNLLHGSIIRCIHWHHRVLLELLRVSVLLIVIVRRWHKQIVLLLLQSHGIPYWSCDTASLLQAASILFIKRNNFNRNRNWRYTDTRS